jgi:hypothetical protein
MQNITLKQPKTMLLFLMAWLATKLPARVQPFFNGVCVLYGRVAEWPKAAVC